jgi:hypothetical protein
MIETATENKGTVFAYDEDGNTICVGDHVIHNRKLYRVQMLMWSSEPSDGYKEEVHLELIHVKTLRIKIVEDCDVALVD